MLRSTMPWLAGLAAAILLSAAGSPVAAADAPRGGAPAEESAAEPVLTLERALDLALQNNRHMQAASLEVDKAGDQLAQLRTRRLPSLNVANLSGQLLTPLNFAVPQGSFGNFSATGPIPANNMNISTPQRWTNLFFASVSQPLTQLYRIEQGIKASEVSQEAATEQMRGQRQAVANQVKRAYFAVLQTQSSLQAAEELVKSYRELDRLVTQQVEQQKALKADSLDVKSRLAMAEHQARRIRNSLIGYKEQLNVLLGREVSAAFTVSEVPSVSPLDIDLTKASVAALRQRPDVKHARLRAEAATYDLGAKKGEYLPDLSLVVDYMNLADINFLPNSVAIVGFQLNWEPFDWGRKHREIAQKQRTIQQANLEVKEAESRTVAEVNDRYRRLEEAYDLLQVTQLAQQSTRERLRVAMNRYNQKAALLQEVLQAQAALAEANNQHSQAVLAFWTAKADFERAAGED